MQDLDQRDIEWDLLAAAREAEYAADPSIAVCVDVVLTRLRDQLPADSEAG